MSDLSVSFISRSVPGTYPDLITVSVVPNGSHRLVSADVMERLRAEVAAWKRQDAMHKKEADDWQAHHGVLEKRLAEKDKRIAELEKENSWKAAKYLLCGDYYPITDEMIDELWKATTPGCQRGVDACAWILWALKRLRVLPCGRCNGGKIVILKKDNSYTGYSTIDCPACHGHGWVWKESSDE